MKKSLLVMGGDRRMEYCAKCLEEAFDVSTYGFSASGPVWELKQADILVLPYLSLSGNCINSPSPANKIPAVSALNMLKYGGILFGGGLTPEFLSYCAERNARVHDFFDDEELTLKNAVLTAEGALEIILRNTDKAVYESEILILGWGRVAKAVAKALSALNAKLTVSARSQTARDNALDSGYYSCGFIDKKYLEKADVVINTVPARVLGDPELLTLKPGAFVLDLASAPYGADPENAKKLGINYTTAPGLPGKTAPETAGKLIAETIKRLAEGGEKENE